MHAFVGSMGAHAAAQAFGVAITILFSAGLPLLYLFVLRHYGKRHKLYKIKHLAFFTRDYTAEMPYWECAECFKRLMLAGAGAMFEAGSLMQIAVSSIIVFSHVLECFLGLIH